MNKIKELSKEELIKAYRARNDDAKDYSKEITRLQKENIKLKKELG